MSQDLPPSDGRSPEDQFPDSYTSQPRQVRVKLPDSRPTVTYALMVITGLVFVGQMVSESMLGGQDLLAMLGMKVNDLILEGQFWRFITPMFLHASILHIAFNMYALFALGPTLERYYGHGRYLALYFVSGFAGNVLSFMFSSTPSLGSSTAIFGLLGAQGVFFYQNRELFGQGARSALINVVMWGAINLVFGFTNPRIDNWGHIGGLLGGILFAYTAGPVLKLAGGYEQLTVEDERDPGDVLRFALLVAGVFVLLAALAIYLQTR